MSYHEPISLVSIATDYGLYGPVIETRWGRDFPRLSRPSLGPTQPLIIVFKHAHSVCGLSRVFLYSNALSTQWVCGSQNGQRDPLRGVKLILNIVQFYRSI
jgi:hypothetical protein